MQVNVDWDRSLGLRDERFFGYFLEHFHRQIYGGIYDPGSPLADENGFRRDVAEAVQRLRPAVLRWPGGCFASAYHWAHGVGPNRLPSYDKAWRVEEPNTFGTDEFIEFCRLGLARFKVPRHVRFIDEWPMSATKIQKFRLQEQLARELAEAREVSI